MATHKMMIAGFGGQGVMLIGQMIAYAGMLEDKEVTWMPSYGPEMRGGTANCTVIVADRRIASPVITEATAVIAMNGPSLEKFQDLLVPGQHLFVNSSLIKEKAHRHDVQLHPVDCNALAAAVGNDKAANMVMLGAAARVTGVVSLAALFEVMEKMFTGTKARLLPLNKQALEIWQ